MSTRPRRMHPGNLESTAIRWKRLHYSAMGCESGRQDSNLRPLVPQTSPHFPMSADFDFEWFCGELVGMTTRACLMESVGVASISRGVRWCQELGIGQRRLAVIGVVLIPALHADNPQAIGRAQRPFDGGAWDLSH